MSNFFCHLDYREILKQLVADRKKEDPSFNFSVLAKALGVQKTYLSKVMNGGGHLSTDQVFCLTEYFALSKEEHDFLVLLLEYEKTGLARRKKILESRIASIQLEARKTSKVLKADFRDKKSDDRYADYYLDPFMTIAHIFLTLPEMRGSAKLVRQRLGLSPRAGERIFSTLEAIGLIEKTKEKGIYRVLQDHLQLSSDSPLCTPYHLLFRGVSLQALARVPANQRFSFSVTFSADDRTRTLIHEHFLKFLRAIEPLVKAAQAKEVLQLNFDLFPWMPASDNSA